MRTVFVLLLFLSPLPTFAQQQTNPAEAALQASTIVTQLGQIAAVQEQQIKMLQGQIATLAKQLEEAKKEAKPDAKH